MKKADATRTYKAIEDILLEIEGYIANKYSISQPFDLSSIPRREGRLIERLRGMRDTIADDLGIKRTDDTAQV